MRDFALSAFKLHYPLGKWEEIETEKLVKLYELWRYQPADFVVIALDLALEWFKGTSNYKGKKSYWSAKAVTGNPTIETLRTRRKNAPAKVKIKFNSYGDAVMLQFKGWVYKLSEGNLTEPYYTETTKIVVAALPPKISSGGD